MSACSLVVAGSCAATRRDPGGECAWHWRRLREAKPLLAADLACNRDVSPNGSGCIWFAAGDAADLGRRIVFLASDAAFRNALVAAGSRYLHQTRAPARIAEQYDAVYWHAFMPQAFGKMAYANRKLAALARRYLRHRSRFRFTIRWNCIAADS